MTDHLDISRYITSQRLSLIKQVTHLAAELGFPACLVGGFVRDALLGKPVNDFDVVVEGDATKLGRALVKHFGGRLTVHAPFKTATWFLPDPPDDFIDLISARSETYPEPATLPMVKLGSLDEDLHRRDFTINAMAIRLNGDGAGELVDPLDGHADLKDGLVRTLHPRSFIDDPTRLFRLIRYAERYAFDIESGTRDLIPSALDYVDRLSPERLRHELDLVLEEENYLPMLDKLWAQGILPQIKPALPFDEGARDRLQCIPLPLILNEIPQARDRRWTAWLMGLPEKNIRALAKRLHFTSDLLKQSIGASELYKTADSLVGLRPSECVARLDKFPGESILVALSCIPKMLILLQKYLVEWRSVKPHTTGETLMLKDVPFGPRIGDILWRLRAARLDGEVTTDAGEEEFLDEMLKDLKHRK